MVVRARNAIVAVLVAAMAGVVWIVLARPAIERVGPEPAVAAGSIAARESDSSPLSAPSADLERLESADTARDTGRFATEGARLRVRVVRKETREPVQGEQIVCVRSNVVDPQATTLATGGQLARERTRSDGTLEFEVVPGVAMKVASREARGSVLVAALSQGEVREVELEVETEPDRVFFGRLVDARSGRAMAGGRIRIGNLPNRADEPSIASDSDGIFELHVRSWIDEFANAEVEGRPLIAFALESEHEVRERPMDVRIPAGARLEVHVRHGLRDIEGETVSAKAGDWFEQEGVYRVGVARSVAVSGTTDARGLALLEPLLPGVPVKVGVQLDASTVRLQMQEVELAPGELRRIEFNLGTDAAIVGRVESSAGKPIAFRRVWRTAAESPLPRLLDERVAPDADERTDVEGRFRFDDVPFGDWHVGLPCGSGEAEMALAQVVRVERESSEFEVVIRTSAGLVVSGRVLDASGAPVPGCRVRAEFEDRSGARDARLTRPACSRSDRCPRVATGCKRAG